MMRPCKKGHPIEIHASGNGYTKCAECNRINARNWYNKNPKYVRDWALRNKEKVRKYKKKWYLANIERSKKYAIEHYLKNREKYILSSRQRKNLVLKATPKWANFSLIKDIYMEAKYQDLVVDHIIPVKGGNVCGLHWEDNLQLLTEKDNRTKGNRYN